MLAEYRIRDNKFHVVARLRSFSGALPIGRHRFQPATQPNGHMLTHGVRWADTSEVVGLALLVSTIYLRVQVSMEE